MMRDEKAMFFMSLIIADRRIFFMNQFETYEEIFYEVILARQTYIEENGSSAPTVDDTLGKTRRKS